MKSEKNIVVAVILCLVFGLIGVHRMYVGKVGTGILMLVMTLSGFGVIISLLLAFVDFISLICGTFKDKQNLIIK
jgi:TM2 domain-containing membrane protein YozV